MQIRLPDGSDDAHGGHHQEEKDDCQPEGPGQADPNGRCGQDARRPQHERGASPTVAGEPLDHGIAGYGREGDQRGDDARHPRCLLPAQQLQEVWLPGVKAPRQEDTLDEGRDGEEPDRALAPPIGDAHLGNRPHLG